MRFVILYVLPFMASLVKKKKGNRLYYYLVESARVGGKPRIVHQAYLGTAEKLAELIQERTTPVPLSATLREFGLPGALWLAAQHTGLWALLESLWPAPHSGPGPAHYLLLAAIHRICDPGPKTEVGAWYLCVVKYSAPFAAEQLHSLTTSISRVLQSLRLFSKRLNKPRARWTEDGIKRKIQKWLSAQFLADLIRYQLDFHNGQWRLQFDLDPTAFTKLIDHRLGRTVLLTNRMDWTAEQVVAGYAGQQQVERVFRGLKDGDWLGWGPMHHWTDRKIRIHAFYCMLGISLLQVVHRQAKAAWADLSMETLLEELRQIQQFVLLYPRQGEKGPDRAAYVLSKQTLVQQALAKALKLDELQIAQRG